MQGHRMAQSCCLPWSWKSFALQQLDVWLWCSNLSSRGHGNAAQGRAGRGWLYRTALSGNLVALNLPLNWWEIQLGHRGRFVPEVVLPQELEQDQEQPCGSHPPGEMLCQSITVPTNPLEQPDDNRLSHYRAHKNIFKHHKKQKGRSEHGKGGGTSVCCTGTAHPLVQCCWGHWGDRGASVGRESPCQCREGERKASTAAITNTPENSGQLLHEQQKPHWPHKPSGAPCGDSINSCKLLQTFSTLSTHFMRRVQ